MTDEKNIIKNRDTVLDFWRGIGVMMVLFQHLVYFRYESFLKEQVASIFSGYSLYGFNFSLFVDRLLFEISEQAGPLGVKIFFVVSGYIITKLLLKEETENARIKAKNFYFRRVMRILPPLIFYLVFLLIFRALGFVQFANLEIFNSAGFLCDVQANQCGWFLVHTWSLAIEGQFYLLWPIFFLIPLPDKKFRVWILTIILILLLVFSAFNIFTVGGWLDMPLSFACIGFGAMFAISERFRILTKKYGLAIISGVSLVAMFIFDFTPLTHNFIYQGYKLIQPFAIVVAIALTYELSWLVKTKLFVVVSKIGLISYSLYLWQQVFAGAPSNYLSNSFLTLPVVMIVFATFSYFIIEKPSTKWAKTILKKYDTIEK